MRIAANLSSGETIHRVLHRTSEEPTAGTRYMVRL
jgi:hypothetical protein